MPHRSYDFEKAHPVAKQFGIHLDTFLYGLEPLCLLLWWGDVQGMRAGVAKVMDGHRQMLARVQQGEATVDGCADQHRTRTRPHARRACVPPLTEPHLERLRCAAGLPMRSGILASVWWRRC